MMIFVHEEKGEKMNDLIYRQAAIDEIEYELEMINSALDSITLDFNARERLRQRRGEAREILNSIQQLPSAQSEIIRCKDCKHWTQSTGKMTGYGLGRCDFHDADLVACNGFCYWAERRTDERPNQQRCGNK